MRFFKPVFAAFVLLTLVASECKDDQEFVWADNYIEDELMVTIKEKATMEEILEDFKDYDAFNKNLVSATGRIYLIKYNTEKITPEEMYYKMRDHKDVIAVEFNKTVDLRD